MNTELIFEILLFSLIPFITMIFGGTMGVLFNVKSSIRSSLLHFAAGVIFAVVAVEIIPAIVSKHNIMGTTVGFFIGLAAMLAIRHFTRNSENKHKDELVHVSDSSAKVNTFPWGMLIGIGVDITIDGILLGVGFAAGQSEGVLLCVALSLEILVLGLVVSTELKNEKFAKKTIFLTVISLSLLFMIGGFIGSVMLSVVSADAINVILAFGLSALIFLVTEELLVEAHEIHDTPLSTAIFFIGFFIFLMISIAN
jgi:ZIP family zinc transporter